MKIRELLEAVGQGAFVPQQSVTSVPGYRKNKKKKAPKQLAPDSVKS